MSRENITREKRASVYAEGKLAFDQRQRRGTNPYARRNLALAIDWWHGWDTAEEESKGERSPLAAHDKNDPTSLRPTLEKPVLDDQTAKHDGRPNAAPRQAAKVLPVPYNAKR